jgi:hypothetical protein
MNFKAFPLFAATLVVMLAAPEFATAQGNSFTYQGVLNSNGTPVSGTYDLSFGLFTSSSGGAATATVTNAGVAVSNGLFTTTLDFGSAFTNGTPYWIEIGVGTNLTNAFTILAPRQPVTSTPYAITARNLTGTVPTSQLTGTIPLSQIQGAVLTNNQTGVTLTGTFTGNGAGLGSLNASSVTSGTLADNFLSQNVALLNRNQTFSGAAQFTNTANSFTGNGAGLTNIIGISNGVISVQMLQPAVAGRLAPPVFGDGSDGNVTISTPVTLTHDMYYSNLTVSALGTLNTAGFRVFVFGTCTITAPGVIQNNGASASGGTLGLGAPTGSLGGGSGGAFGTTGAAGAGTNVSNGAGGAGGKGGAGTGTFAGGAGGTVAPVDSTNGGLGVLRTFPNAFTGRDLASQPIQGGAGGGGGGGVGGGSQAGGGGGGGGVILLAAPLITGNGTVRASGGNGGNAPGSGAGGGGGGGGGCVIIISEQAPGGVTFNVSGGAGGAGAGGAAGATGSTGTVILLH